MNSISGEQLLKALNAVFGKELKTVSPVGQNICMDDGRAAIILKGAMDLFIARHRENNTHGFPMALCDRMNAGTLVPPFHRNPLTLFFGRCLPDTEIVLLPMNDVLKKMHEGDNVLWNCCLKFAENAGWSKLPKTVPAFLQSFSDLCVDSFVQLQKTEGLTRTLIRNNFNEQKRKERGVIHVFSSLFGRTKEYTAPFDPSDPAAAAAAYTAEKSGIEDFVLEKEQTLERRIAWSMDHQNLRITPVVLNGPWYKECFAPMMIISADGKNAYCAYCNKHNDPVAWDGSSGELFEIDHQFSKTIQTIGWNFVKPLPNGPVSWGSMLHFFFGFFKPSVPRQLFYTLMATFFSMLIPVINSLIFSDVIPNADKTLLWQLFLLLLVSSCVKTIIDVFTSSILWDINEQAEYSMQTAVFDRMMQLPVNFFRNYSPGDLSMRVMGIHTLFIQLQTHVFHSLFNILFVIFPIILLFYYSVTLACLMLLIFLITAILIIYASWIISKHQYSMLQRNSELNGLLERFISGIAKIRAARALNHAFLVWAKKYTENKRIYTKFYMCSLAATLTISLLPWIIFCTSTAVIVLVFQNGPEQMSVADFTGFISTVGLISGIIISFLGNLNAALQIIPHFKWLNPLLQESVEEDGAESVNTDVIRGALELDNVSFSYDKERQIINKVSLKAEPGEFIAITGESGSGKSTLLRLMLRFERPSSGTVLFDGEDISNKNIRKIRSQIGVVMQNANVLPDSILHNIVGNTSLYTEDDAWRAAEMADCAEDIRNFPMQMQTLLIGSSVSGGQKQRIMLAHAVIHKPKMIFLDEATSALDNYSQKVVIDAMSRLEATKIVIAHRLSTIINADRIYVLDHGEIAEIGTFRELMKKQGLFAKMAARQLLEYKENDQ